ncbi:hypothetical protein G3I59_14090 [Amycolatopsis rubida]|uniref:HEAT repeat domain-containing protein n=1 Tax=Amycolatopsis rubida TaxID=112413 RepID=A0ABX0BMU2_9PSEU|nr:MULTISPECIES: hypothetical protein [Amycolatopsis]MYW91702.1 hypothetical protein [Amycolatopsis rubida]NEC56686.1 hypothetical protein [Amycolatopsis rubida]OAP20422.1 hypothetical protein A4R44_08846 [Amycolatopsis sp. M39]
MSNAAEWHRRQLVTCDAEAERATETFRRTAGRTYVPLPPLRKVLNEWFRRGWCLAAIQRAWEVTPDDRHQRRGDPLGTRSKPGSTRGATAWERRWTRLFPPRPPRTSNASGPGAGTNSAAAERPAVRAGAHRIEVRALEAVTERKLPAVLRLRDWLRFAHASGYWGTANHVRRLLARAYQDAGEPDRAAALLIQAARLKDADELARATGDRYVDVRHDLTAPAYWVPAAAFRILAVQADRVPDDHVNEIVDAALDVLDRHRAGQLQDAPFFSPSLALEATKAAAALAGRTTIEQASRLLDHLEPSVPRGLDHSRDTDDDHVAACVAIATSHSALREAAVAQLLDLLAQTRSGVAHRVETSASELFSQHPDLVRPRLAELAAEGNRHAGALLSLITDEPSEAQLTAARAAAVELMAASKNTAQSIGAGAGAGRQSLLALHLPPEERTPLVRAQLDRAASPYEPGTNRSEYYLAAAALSDGLEDVDALFEEAMGRADDARPRDHRRRIEPVRRAARPAPLRGRAARRVRFPAARRHSGIGRPHGEPAHG